MENNNYKNENNENKQPYSDVNGTGPISTLAFTMVATVLMHIISRLMGY